MKKMITSAVLIFTSLSAFADNNKVGIVFLNGKNHNVLVQERSASGLITVDNQVFKIASGGIHEVEGRATTTVNGKLTKDMNIIIQFRASSEKELQEIVDNKTEVKCDSQSNSIVLISNNISGSVIGNCAVLNGK